MSVLFLPKLVQSELMCKFKQVSFILPIVASRKIYVLIFCKRLDKLSITWCHTSSHCFTQIYRAYYPIHFYIFLFFTLNKKINHSSYDQSAWEVMPVWCNSLPYILHIHFYSSGLSLFVIKSDDFSTRTESVIYVYYFKSVSFIFFFAFFNHAAIPCLTVLCLRLLSMMPRYCQLV